MSYAQEMTVEEMQTHIRYHLSTRESTRYLNLLSQLPGCLTAAMYDYRTMKSEWKSIIKMLDKPVITLSKQA